MYFQAWLDWTRGTEETFSCGAKVTKNFTLPLYYIFAAKPYDQLISEAFTTIFLIAAFALWYVVKNTLKLKMIKAK